MNAAKNSEKYVPKLHPNMPDWKKILYYNHHVTEQFPRLDGKPIDMTTDTYKIIAIHHVNEILEREKVAYENRVKRREQMKLAKEERERVEKEKREKLHVEEMTKKYGWDWYRDVEDTDEDCKTACLLREEEQREDEIAYWENHDETIRYMKEAEEDMDRKEHQKEFFATRMTIELRNVPREMHERYIQDHYNIMREQEWEDEMQFDAELEAEGDAWCRSMERAHRHREQKKARIAAYEAAK
jgi:hypothetical protein